VVRNTSRRNDGLSGSGTLMVLMLILLLLALLAFVLGPRPRLDATAPDPTVPAHLDMTHLKAWLAAAEASVDNLIEDAEARVDWANPDAPEATEFSFLYIHGFSASRQETTPVTDRLASEFGANMVHARLAGHGVDPGMDATAEQWLQSVVDAWTIAESVGKRVVIVGTSTGATLAVWLADQTFTRGRIHAMLFMSPNFGIRTRFSFLLTWPWAYHWVPLVIGREHAWDPENELAAKFWTTRYPIHAVIEMQKTVDWVMRLDFSRFDIPLATMYMQNDSTIDPWAAVKVHEAWGRNNRSLRKVLIPVTLDGEAAQHVFVGDITAPHRVDWAVSRFEIFLKQLPPTR
jgi:esterase/lipase